MNKAMYNYVHNIAYYLKFIHYRLYSIGIGDIYKI